MDAITTYYHKSRTTASNDESDRAERDCVAVVVLGDLGRSPRMLYHALALADAGVRVDLYGYLETELDAMVAGHPAVVVHELSAPSPHAGGRGFVIHGLARVLRQGVELFRQLASSAPHTILVQTPPAIPTLLVALVAARRAGARLVVDWHNFGWSLMTDRLDAKHPVVLLARWWEHVLGRRADAQFCVSRAMADELSRCARIEAAVLYDRPAERFMPLRGDEQRSLRASLADELRLSRPPALVVVPTGWTADEDLGLLLDAAIRLDATIVSRTDDVADVVILLTGRGPFRERWVRRFEALSLRRVHLVARWLAPDEDPMWLAAADVGVSLHRSASGVDLPMKIADLLGSGVPVCALAYDACLGEILDEGQTGLFFETADQLAEQLELLLADVGGDPLATLRRNIDTAARERWRDGWARVARSVLLPGNVRC